MLTCHGPTGLNALEQETAAEMHMPGSASGQERRSADRISEKLQWLGAWASDAGSKPAREAADNRGSFALPGDGNDFRINDNQQMDPSRGK